MPLCKSVTINNDTRLLVWKITESLEELSTGTGLKEVCAARVQKMKSEQHRKGFMSVRKLMEEAGYTDFDLYYDTNGKPHLNDGNAISITHSYTFSAIIISKKNSGIDMEMQRPKVVAIADKFIEKEFTYLNSDDTQNYIRMLIAIWGVKESVYKMLSKPGLSFKQNIEVLPFTIEDGKGSAVVDFEGHQSTHPFYFEEVEGFTLVYCLENL
ncbi:4'-phosphopantetheinyl transferase family protein [Flavobacterium rhizosphaerae]|uniref:4'-phosphopantetheinyl transferase superfamily protein n=1 Tax=Flavobacterium rhizosphaerae TaxID=3163298 RepID=A0ABW8YZH6_9FLAO